MVGAVLMLTVGSLVARVVRERLALGTAVPADSARPNVLLLIEDTVRPANLSVYGYSRPTTPELERLAHEGATFDLAFSTSPWTLKSHATMFTGLYPNQLAGDFHRPVRTKAPTLAELFRAGGYATGAFVANLIYMSRETGLSRGFGRYDDYHPTRRQVLRHSWIGHTPIFTELIQARTVGQLVRAGTTFSLKFNDRGFNNRTYERRPAGEIAAAFLKWQGSLGNRPFFAFLNFFDAHEPYRSPPAFGARFALDDNKPVGAYDGAIANIDHEIGRLLDELRRRGVLDNTIVVVTSDHGEQFGEHGLHGHANSLYLPLLQVPLLIRYPPRVPASHRVVEPVTLRDLAATIVDLAGLRPHSTVPGVSLTGRWVAGAGSAPGSEIKAYVEQWTNPDPEWPVRYGPMSSAFDERFHYILRGDGAEELFEYRTDSLELRNLATSAETIPVMARLRALVGGKTAP